MDKFEIIKKKIIARESLKNRVACWKFKAKKIVFTNGCFDLLHRGHIEYLAKAASEGDILIIGLNTDASVKRLKGPSRPVQDEYSRALILASLQFVSAVVFFDEDTPYELIQLAEPDVLIKGGDYNIDQIVGYDLVTKNGGVVKTIDFVEGFSTTNILRSVQ